MNRKTEWLAAVGMVAVLLAGCGNNSPDLMERAQQQQEEGRYQSAMADYRALLQEEPDNAEARFRLGQVSLRLGESSSAEDAFRRAQRLGVSPDRVQPLLATALLWQEKFTAVINDIDPESVSDIAIRADLKGAIGMAHAQTDNPREARRYFDAALSEDPRSVRALVGAARLAEGAGLTGEAVIYLDRAVDVDPESSAAWLVRAEVERRQGEYEDAVDLYRRVLELPPRDISHTEYFNARGRLVETLISLDRRDEARDEVATMLRQGSRHPYSNYLAAVLAFGDDDLATANDHLQRALSASPDSLSAKSLMGAVRFRQGQYAQAIALLQDVVAGQPDDLRARLMLSAALRENGEDRQAARVLATGIRHFVDDPEAIAQLARAAGDDLDAVIADLDRVAQTQGELAVRRARLGLAQALVGEGVMDPAMAMLEQLDAGTVDEEITRRQFLALAALRVGDMDRARNEAERLVRENPDNPSALNLLGGVYLTLERFDDARRTFNDALRLEPDHAQTLFNLGLLEVAEGDLDAAAERMQEGLDRAPNNVGVMLRLAEVNERRGDYGAAQAMLERASEAAPNAVQPVIALARLHLGQGDVEEAASAANRAVRLAPNNALAHALQGVARLRLNNTEGAVESLQTAHRLAPADGDIAFQLARAQVAADEQDAAAVTLQAITEQHPGRADAPLALARLYLQRGEPEDALALAERLQGHEERAGLGSLIEGHAHAARDDEQAAVAAYQRAVDAGQRDALGPLVAHRNRMGIDDPAAPMERWVEANPDDVPARLALATWYGEQGDHPRMVRQYERMVELTGRRNAVLLNNLAWGYGELDDPRALETAEAAYELAPGNPAVIDTLGWIVFKTGEHDRAVELLAEAAAGAPDNAQILYHYGAALQEAGSDEPAREHLQRALDLESDAEWAADAQRRLDALQ